MGFHYDRLSVRLKMDFMPLKAFSCISLSDLYHFSLPNMIRMWPLIRIHFQVDLTVSDSTAAFFCGLR